MQKDCTVYPSSLCGNAACVYEHEVGKMSAFQRKFALRIPVSKGDEIH